jgi:hypothetical protein
MPLLALLMAVTVSMRKRRHPARGILEMTRFIASTYDEVSRRASSCENSDAEEWRVYAAPSGGMAASLMLVKAAGMAPTGV